MSRMFKKVEIFLYDKTNDCVIRDNWFSNNVYITELEDVEWRGEMNIKTGVSVV